MNMRDKMTTKELHEQMDDSCKNCGRPRFSHIPAMIPERVALYCFEWINENEENRKEYSP